MHIGIGFRNSMFPMKFSGIVQAGKKEARKFGIPTANISTRSKIKSGVYFSKCKLFLSEDEYLEFSALSYVPPDAPLLETHIFNFDKDIYGEKIEVQLVQLIRGYIDYKDDIQSLKRQLQMDLQKVNEIAKNYSKLKSFPIIDSP